MKRRLAQLVERLPYKQNVTGSSPVLPSNSSICQSTSYLFSLELKMGGRYGRNEMDFV